MLAVGVQGNDDVCALGCREAGLEGSALAYIYRMAYDLGPGQLCNLCGPVSAAVVDDDDAVRVLPCAQNDRAYADFLIVGREDGGYGGHAGSSRGWVLGLVVGCSGRNIFIMLLKPSICVNPRKSVSEKFECSRKAAMVTVMCIPLWNHE